MVTFIRDGQFLIDDVDKEASQTGGSPRSFVAQRTLAQDDNLTTWSSQVLVWAEFRFSFCERAKENVRAKGRAVNSVFLVQLRKMLATDFPDQHGLKRLSKNVVPRRIQGLVLIAMRREEKLSDCGRADCAQRMHRKCRKAESGGRDQGLVNLVRLWFRLVRSRDSRGGCLYMSCAAVTFTGWYKVHGGEKNFPGTRARENLARRKVNGVSHLEGGENGKIFAKRVRQYE
jgi:hypothetical protein